MATVSGALSADQITTAYRALCDALRAHRLTLPQIEALVTILTNLHASATVLATSPQLARYADDPVHLAFFQAGAAGAAVDAFARALAALPPGDRQPSETPPPHRSPVLASR